MKRADRAIASKSGVEAAFRGITKIGTRAEISRAAAIGVMREFAQPTRWGMHSKEFCEDRNSQHSMERQFRVHNTAKRATESHV